MVVVAFTRDNFTKELLENDHLMAVNQYFVHILLLVTDNDPSWKIQQKGDWP